MFRYRISLSRTQIALLIAGGLLLAVAPLSLVTAGLTGAAFILVLLLRPVIGLWILPFAVPFGSLREVPVAGFGIGATEVITGLTLVAWVARGIVHRRLEIKAPPLLIPLLLLIGTMLLSARGMYAVPATAKELVKWTEILIVYVLVFNLIEDRQASLILVVTLLVAGSLSALHGIAGSLLRLGPPQFAILGGRLYRAFGTFGQPNPFGGYMNHTLPIAVSLLMATLLRYTGEGDKDRRRQGESETGKRSTSKSDFTEKSPLGGPSRADFRPRGWMREPFFNSHKSSSVPNISLSTRHPVTLSPPHPFTSAPLLLCTLALIGTSGTLAAGLMLSWSRGAWLGAAAGLATVASAWLAVILSDVSEPVPSVLRWRIITLLWLGTVVIIVSMLLGGLNLLPASIGERIDSAVATFTTLDVRGVDITNANFATLERIAHWQAAWGMWRDHFWTGVGIGNYAAAYPEYHPPKWPDALGHAHNIYFNMGAETGFVGLAAYLLFVASALWHSGQVARRSSGPAIRGFVIGVVGVLIALAVHNFFDNMYVHAMGIQLALALGLVSALGRHDCGSSD